MTQILIANNKKLKYLLNVEQNDTLIFFNYLESIDPKIYEKNEKIWVMRIKQSFLKNMEPHEEPYAGMNLVKNYCYLFSKICLFNKIDTLPKNNQKICYDNIKNNKILEIDKYVENLKKEIAYPKYKNMSTGLIYYNYLQKKEPGCKILLAGFTSEVNKNYHHASWERNYFKKELNSGRCEMLW